MMSLTRLSLVCFALAVLLSVVAIQASADPPEPGPPETHELIILLKPEASATAELLVESVNSESIVPFGLGLGAPQAASRVVADPLGGRLSEWVEHNPYAPEAMLQRYVVLRYPETANFEAIAEGLSHNPHVDHVEFNQVFHLSAVPNDPYVGDGTEQPEDAQWGVHELNLPAAWDLTDGHGYVGVLDEGLEVNHSELRPSHLLSGLPVYDGGAFRAHMSRDVMNNNCSVDESDPNDTAYDPHPGHGSFVSGVVAATTNNGSGVAGACRACSLMSVKASPTSDDPSDIDEQLFYNRAATGLAHLATHGAGVVNMSFGNSLNQSDCPSGGSVINLSAFCTSLKLAHIREVVMVAASGNDGHNNIDFPGSDARVIAVGGIEANVVGGVRTTSLWVNSNTGPEQDLVGPAKDIVATAYTGKDHLLMGGCGDSEFLNSNDGIGLCSGTSMAAPFVSGVASVVRSANPLLDKSDVRDALVSTASIPGTKDPALGHGTPDAGSAVGRSLGLAGGQQITNRLSPLFVLKGGGSGQKPTHAYTTSPQMASWLLLNTSDQDYNTAGNLTLDFAAFPGFCTEQAVDCCPITQSCCVDCDARILATSTDMPRASVYVFTTNKDTLAPGSPGAPLVPLYRMRYESALSDSCPSPPSDPVSTNRDFGYAVSTAEVEEFLGGITLGTNVYKYKLDGIEGYIYEDCSTGCPPGVVALHRLYNATLHDMVLVPASEVATMQAQGYLPQGSLDEIVGYAFPNVDGDDDGVIDGFERIVGTSPSLVDSDGDGPDDFEELIEYDSTDPNPALHGYGDPCTGGCPLFADGFEVGSAAYWSFQTP